MLRLILILSLLMISACGPTLKGPKFSDYHSQLKQVESNKSRINFLIPGKTIYGYKAKIYIDGEQVIKLPRGGCYITEITPGQHKLLVNEFLAISGAHEINFNAKASTDHFMRIGLRKRAAASRMLFGSLGGGIEMLTSDKNNDGAFEMTEITNSEAKPLMKDCVYYLKENQ